MQHFFKKTLCILALLFCFTMPSLFGQGGPGGPGSDPGCDPCCPRCPQCPPQCIPIDGGLGFLIAAGLGVGVWRAGRKKEQIVDPEHLPGESG